MSALVLDSGAVTWLATPSRRAADLIRSMRRSDMWPPIIPSVVLVECLTGRDSRDVATNRLINSCTVIEQVPTSLARRAASLRATARRGSAVDALVVALAEPHGLVLTGDVGDLVPLAAQSRVSVREI